MLVQQHTEAIHCEKENIIHVHYSDRIQFWTLLCTLKGIFSTKEKKKSLLLASLGVCRFCLDEYVSVFLFNRLWQGESMSSAKVCFTSLALLPPFLWNPYRFPEYNEGLTSLSFNLYFPLSPFISLFLLSLSLQLFFTPSNLPSASYSFTPFPPTSCFRTWSSTLNVYSHLVR